MAHGKVEALRSDREAAKAEFLARAGLAAAAREPLTGVASGGQGALSTAGGWSMKIRLGPPGGRRRS